MDETETIRRIYRTDKRDKMSADAIGRIPNVTLRKMRVVDWSRTAKIRQRMRNVFKSPKFRSFIFDTRMTADAGNKRYMAGYDERH